MPLSLDVDVRIETRHASPARTGSPGSTTATRSSTRTACRSTSRSAALRQTRTIAGFGDAPCPYTDPFPGCGVGSVMLLTTGLNELALTRRRRRQ